MLHEINATKKRMVQYNYVTLRNSDITERDRRQKFRPNQNVLRDVTSRWSMRITAHSSDS